MSGAPIFKDPEDLLFELGIARPEEIDLFAIAQFCKAHVIEEVLDGIEGRIIGNTNEAFITINSNSTFARKRFSIGHELGHWMYDRGKPFFNCAKKDMRKWDIRKFSDPEVRANRYSADLLLPKSMFVPIARGKPITFNSVRELMVKFQSSLTATAIRLVELGSYPSMLICTENGVRKWFCRNHIVPEFVWPIQNLSKESLAIDLLKGTESFKKGTVSADSWVTTVGSDEYEVVEDSIKIGNETILSIVWWKNEAQISRLT